MNDKSAQHAPQRLSKRLAAAGYGSRRQIDTWISHDQITVNGKPAVLGQKVTAADRIRIKNKAVGIRARSKHRMLAYYKPAGQICTRSDEKGRETVFSKLPIIHSGRWIAIGRLDYNTQGLLLFTTDGALAHKLMHPKTQIEREYAVRISNKARQDQLALLKRGVKLEDGLARFTHIHHAGGNGNNHWYHVILTEGRNHEVKRLWESQNLCVTRLIRIRFGNFKLPRQKRVRQYWHLHQDQLEKFYQLADMNET